MCVFASSLSLKKKVTDLWGLIEMAFKRALTWFSIFMVMLMVVLLPFVQSSRTRFQGGTTVAEDTNTATEELETIMVNRFGDKGGSVLTIEDSAREVPTGPDPLHHNDKPTGP